jgi:hypothetical protein
MGPLAQSDARLLFECLALGVGRGGDTDAAEAAAELSGGIPWLIHHIAHRLPAGEGPATRADIVEVFDEFVRDRDASSALTHLVTRLGLYYGDDEQLAEQLLDLVAQSEVAIPFDDLARRLKKSRAEKDRLRTVADLLEGDHYLITQPAGVTWRYDVLRRVWLVRRRLA